MQKALAVATRQCPLFADIAEKAVRYSSDGESSPCLGDGLEGLFGRRLGRHPGRYAARITGSIFIGLRLRTY